MIDPQITQIKGKICANLRNLRIVFLPVYSLNHFQRYNENVSRL